MKKTIILIYVILIASIFQVYPNKNTTLKLPALVGDNMVLQQKTKIRVWGWASPGDKISVSGSWNSKVVASAITDNSGNWIAELNTPKAGGPYNVTVIGDTTIVLKNILIGEVWLCSGQSNMEWPLVKAESAKEEIPQANYPKIRLFRVERKIGLAPMSDVNGKWQECNSETVPFFSAVGYFFGKELYNQLNIPIGLIASYWGGTNSETWTSAETLKKFEYFNEPLGYLKSIENNIEEIAKHEDDSITSVIDNILDFENTKNEDVKNKWMATEFNTSDWDTIFCPSLWQNSKIGYIQGIVWFRKTIDIPEDWENEELALELGPIDEMDATYFNGALIGKNTLISNWNKDRNYTIPASLVKSGKATIAIRMGNKVSSGGFIGKENQMKIYPIKEESPSIIALSGEWLCKTATKFPSPSLLNNRNTPTFLFNGMIHPLLNYSIKGAIWYQGEANAIRAYQYRTIFPALIDDWRNKFVQNNDFPFYFVQIAPFNYNEPYICTELQEAQLLTLSKVKNTGMAVTLDIGNHDNIHPTNKRDVGKRLSLWALHFNYGKDVVYSGPLYESIKIKDDKAIVSFKYIGSGLISKGDKLTQFEIAGDDKIYHPAEAEIVENTIVAYSKDVKKPVAVRYAWHNKAIAEIFNKEGLPASSFSTDNWDRITQTKK